MKRLLFAAPILLSATLTQTFTHAQGNLVANGSFETLFSGWQGTYGQYENADFAVDGRTTGVVIDVGSSSVGETMHQTLSTEPSVPYMLRFHLLSGAGRAGEQSPPGASPVLVRWGNQTLGQFANTSTTTWRLYEIPVTATAFQTELNFASLGTRWQLIDAVSVTVVPEPLPIALFALGALICISGRTRKAESPRRSRAKASHLLP